MFAVALVSHIDCVKLRSARLLEAFEISKFVCLNCFVLLVTWKTWRCLLGFLATVVFYMCTFRNTSSVTAEFGLLAPISLRYGLQFAYISKM